MSAEKDAARDRLLAVLPHIRLAVEMAKKSGKVELGILSTGSDGSGKVLARFEFAEFLRDLALVLDAPLSTEKDRALATAHAIVDLVEMGAPSEAFSMLVDEGKEHVCGEEGTMCPDCVRFGIDQFEEGN